MTIKARGAGKTMNCICEDIDHCYIEEFLLERASCLPEQATNYHDIAGGTEAPTTEDESDS